ncbi:MAG: hypothetical protein Q9198_009404, partial [Flavoplaca austrocitrina]
MTASSDRKFSYFASPTLQYLPIIHSNPFTFKVASAIVDDLLALGAPYLQSTYRLLPESLQAYIDALSSHLDRSSSHQLAALIPKDRNTQALLTLLLPILLLVFSMSSWGRFWPPGGRYSPFAATPTQAPPTVTEADYHYLGPEDIDPPTQHRNDGYNFPAPAPHRITRTDSNTPDILVLKHRSTTYPLHFPAYAIADGDITVGEVRRLAARETKTEDPYRIKLLYKGKILRDDALPCREEGLKQNSEIMCVVSEASSLPSHQQSSSSASEDEMIENGMTGPRVDVDGVIRDDRPRDRPRRKGHRGGRKKKTSSSTSTPKDSSTYLAPEMPYSTNNGTHHDRNHSPARRDQSPFPPRPTPSPAPPAQKPPPKLTN